MHYRSRRETSRRAGRTTSSPAASRPLRAAAALLAATTLAASGGCGRSVLSTEPLQDGGTGGRLPEPDAEVPDGGGPIEPDGGPLLCLREATANGEGDAILTIDTRNSPRLLEGTCGGRGPEVLVDWTAPDAGTYVFSTAGSTHDTVLYLYDRERATSPCEAQRVRGVCSDDLDDSDDSSELTLRLARDETVTLVLDTWGSGGSTRLNVERTDNPPPPPDRELDCVNGDDDDDDGDIDCDDRDCAGRPACASDCELTDLGTAIGRNVFVGHTGMHDNAYTGTCGGDEAPDVLLTWTAPRDGEFAFDTRGSSFDSVLYAVRVGAECGAAVELPDACSDDATDTDHHARVTLRLTGGDTVGLVLDGYAGDSGDARLNILPASARPEQCTNGDDDDFNGLTDCEDPACAMHPKCEPVELECPTRDLGVLVGTASGSTRGLESQLATPCGGEQSPEEILSWTAPQDGTYRLSTRGSSYDTVLAVFPDGVCGDPTLKALACNDDGDGTSDSELTLTARAMQRFVIVVDGWSGDQGEYVLQIEPEDGVPPESVCDDGLDDDGDGDVDCDDDDCDDDDACDEPPPPPPMCELTDLGSQVGRRAARGTTADAGDDSDAQCGGAGAPDVRLRWTAPAEGVYQFDTFGSNFDTVLYAWEANEDCEAAPIAGACSNDAREVSQSLFILTLREGHTLDLIIDGESGESGNYNLNVTAIEDTTAVETDCFNGRDDDDDGLVDCQDDECVMECTF